MFPRGRCVDKEAGAFSQDCYIAQIEKVAMVLWFAGSAEE